MGGVFSYRHEGMDVKDAETPLIVHVIHALGVGGLENGLVNLINHMPAARYRHAIVCMQSFTDFRKRLVRDDVEVIAMNRGTVPLWETYVSLFALFRRLRPSIVHTRNLSGLDALVPALCAGSTIRIHGEHGRDIDDVQGSNSKYRRLRRLFRPLITHYTTVSKDLERYLRDQVGVPERRITQIYNGVDTIRFHPPEREDAAPYSIESGRGPKLTVGTVGRLQPVKDQVTLVRAFAEAFHMNPDAMRAARLVIVGEGPLREELDALVSSTGLGGSITMLGERHDVADVLRSFDLFVLPSRDEGISNTILEAMATGIPVLATRVGGNPELVRVGEVGQLVPAADPQSMARWILRYVQDGPMRRRQGLAARTRVEQEFSLAAMVNGYLRLYDGLRTNRGVDRADNFKKSIILP